ncbi:MAG: hypothetical protein Q8Q04_00650 [archaeon]|nr:hypothetical protein [archaeon]
MTLSNKDDLKKKGTELLNPRVYPRGAEIYMLLFLKDWTKLEISKKVYPYLYDDKKKEMVLERRKRGISNVWGKSKIHRAVSDYVSVFYELGWLKKRLRKQSSPGKDPEVYQATLKPYFEYLEKERQIELSIYIKKTIENYAYKCRDLIFWLSGEKGNFTDQDYFIKHMDNFVKVIIFNFLDLNSSQFKKSSEVGYELANEFLESIDMTLLGQRLYQQFLVNYAERKLSEEEAEGTLELIFKLGGYDAVQPGGLYSDILIRIEAEKNLQKKLKKEGERFSYKEISKG